MSGFTIPNTPDAFNQNQAEPDSLDFQILGKHVNGVVSGMAVSPGAAGATVAVGSGEVLINNSYLSYGGNLSIPLTTFTSSNFFDIIVARRNGSSVEIVVLPGVTGTNPRFTTAVNHSTDTVLASVWRTSSSTPSVNHITDKRVFVRTNANRVGPTASGGNHADVWVQPTTWTPSDNLEGPISVNVNGTWYRLARYSENFTAGTVTATTFIGNLQGNATTATTASAVTNGVYNNGGTYSINITGSAGYATSAGSAGSATTAGSTGILSNGSGGGQIFGTGGFDLRPGSYNGETLSVHRGTSQPTGAFTQAWRNSSGTVLSYITHTGAFVGPSDRSLKDNIKDADYESLCNAIDNIKVKTFEYKFAPNITQIGIIAQEIVDYIPDIVDGDEGTYGVNEVKFVYPLIAKVQQLEKRLQALENG